MTSIAIFILKMVYVYYKRAGEKGKMFRMSEFSILSPQYYS